MHSAVSKILQILKIFFGFLLSVGGVTLIIYNAYWLMTRSKVSGNILGGLGIGFAILFIIVGVVLLLIGGILLYFSRKRK
ncbi:MAG: hypothetical protein QXQ18_02225 [Candidatus Aenigmatarchaeota archaeon]